MTAENFKQLSDEDVRLYRLAQAEIVHRITGWQQIHMFNRTIDISQLRDNIYFDLTGKTDIEKAAYLDVVKAVVHISYFNIDTAKKYIKSLEPSSIEDQLDIIRKVYELCRYLHDLENRMKILDSAKQYGDVLFESEIAWENYNALHREWPKYFPEITHLYGRQHGSGFKITQWNLECQISKKQMKVWQNLCNKWLQAAMYKV